MGQACGCVCWSPSSSKDSVCVAAGYSDGTLRIFRLASSEMEMKLHPHRVVVTAIQYSANGERACKAKKHLLYLPSFYYLFCTLPQYSLSLSAYFGDCFMPFYTLQRRAMNLFDPGLAVSGPTGHVILSAGKNGLVAVSSSVNGATIRVIRDHKGAQITTIQCVNEQVSSLNQTKE